MKIALAQIDCTVNDAAANLEHMLAFIRRAKTAGCQLIVFPELADVGYHMASIDTAARSLDQEPASILAKAAGDSDIYVLCGLSERTTEGIYNSLAVFSNRGELQAKYRKVHLSTPFEEEKSFQFGNQLLTTTIGDLKFGFLICYDLRFPELCRSLVVEQGAEVLINCAAWPYPRLAHWKVLNQARAIENQAYMLCVNRVGTDEGISFGGGSAVISPYGVTISSASNDLEELIIADIDRQSVAAVRSRMQALPDRRSDLY